MAKITPLPHQKTAVKTLVVLHRAENAIRSKAGQVINKYGLTVSQFGALEALYSLGPMCMKELGQKILTTPGNMTVLVRNLRKNDWIRTKPDAEDGRRQLLELTEQGQDLIEKILPEHFSNLTDIFSLLTSSEQEVVTRILKKFKEADWLQ